MDQEWSLCCFSDSVNTQYMIKVGMGRDDTRCCGVEIFDKLQDSFRLVTRIDN
jgi:hypothetical protein